MANLAFIWKENRRDTEALKLMEKCVIVRTRVLGVNHPHTLSSSVALHKWRVESNTISDELGDLPPRWRVGKTASGDIYYMDDNTRRTTWARLGLIKVLDPSPPGWEARLTATGQVYYVDHTTQKTT